MKKNLATNPEIPEKFLNSSLKMDWRKNSSSSCMSYLSSYPQIHHFVIRPPTPFKILGPFRLQSKPCRKINIAFLWKILHLFFLRCPEIFCLQNFCACDYYCYYYVMRSAIWYHLYNLKNMRTTHGGVLLLVKFQAKPAILLKTALLHGDFSRFLNCINGTKSCKISHVQHFLHP